MRRGHDARAAARTSDRDECRGNGFVPGRAANLPGGDARAGRRPARLAGLVRLGHRCPVDLLAHPQPALGRRESRPQGRGGDRRGRRAPDAARAVAAARPIPDAPPTTTAPLPWISTRPPPKPLRASPVWLFYWI